MTTKIYPEHVISAYVLYKIGRGDSFVNSEEAASVIPALREAREFEPMRMTYRSSALEKYSPEFRSYFGSLNGVNFFMVVGEEESFVLNKGIEHAVEVMRGFRKEHGEKPADRLQEIIGDVLRRSD